MAFVQLLFDVVQLLSGVEDNETQVYTLTVKTFGWRKANQLTLP